jgi:ribosomal-protein-serine acetyltransferase
MLIRPVDDEIELRLLEQRHAEMIESLEPGDLSFAQGEWGEWTALEGGGAEWVAAALAEFGQGTRLEVGILKGGLLLGIIALHKVDRQRGSADIDYCMDSRYRNQGIMTRACSALVSYAFADVGLNRLQICSDTANLPGLRVAEKLGFKKEGVLRSYYRSAEGFRDCALYSMLKDEWDRGDAR